jgi:hypothetical protein
LIINFISKTTHAEQEYLFVDQEVGGSIPPNRTNLFNDLRIFPALQVLYGVHMASNLDGNYSQQCTT